MLAVSVLVAAEARAENVEFDDRRPTPSAQEGPTVTDWIKSVLPSNAQNEAEASEQQTDSEPEAPAQQPAKKRRTASKPKPEPEPKPKSEAEQKWWEEVANPVVFTFRDCLAKHTAAEIRRGSQSSYPEFVTEAMHGPCKGEFATMAKLILDEHGEDEFAKIAKELIATTFMPAVKEAAENAPAEVEDEEQDPTAVLKAEMHRDKEAMFGCFTNEADRLATTSTAPAEQLAQSVIRSCRPRAQAYFDKLAQLYPGAAGASDDNSTAILNTTYRPAIVSRIKHMRASTLSSRQ